ncbi:MAG: CBS domain-containing protein [Chromatiales bacterium]|jgi:acetoin utilization protein AcuB|nr:CBS domain-containing protein [Chromatiales bacterium]
MAPSPAGIPPPPPPAAPALVTVGEVMSNRLVTVGMDDTLGVVQMLFRAHQFHHLLVLEGRTLVGVISDRDLLKALSPALGTPNETARDRATLNRHAHQIMTRHPVTVPRDRGIEAAARRMLEAKVSSLPVVATEDDDVLVGIVTWKDLLKALLPPAPA